MIDNRNQLDKNFNNAISKNFLHYNCSDEDICLGKDKSDWMQNSKKFRIHCYDELKYYVSDGKIDDYMAVLCGLRIMIEEFLYKNLSNETEKEEFINTNKTTKKIEMFELYNQSFELPHSFIVTSILYNDVMHNAKGAKDQERRKYRFIAYKLNNITIKSMITEIYNYCKETIDI